MTILGLKGEIQLLEMLKQHDFRCVHRLEQRKITEFLTEASPSIKQKCEQLLRKNRMLPREHLTYQVDLFAWMKDHWAALAIEQKESTGARKVLDLTKDEVVLKAVCFNGIHEYRKSGRQFYLQCKGEGLLTQAYCHAAGIDATALPIGVVDYDLRINSRIRTDWAYHRGVFFMNKKAFSWFLNEYKEDKKWIKDITEDEPKIAYNKAYENRQHYLQ